MNNEFFEALDILEKERGIPKNYILEKVEAALISAYKQEFHKDSAPNIKVVIDGDKKEVHMYRQFNVVEVVENPGLELTLEQAKTHSRRATIGSVIEEELKTKEFGRIAAGTAKQVVKQAIREAEKGMLAQQYEDKKEEILSACVSRVDTVSGNAYVEIGKNELMLPKNEQIPGEILSPGDYIKVYLVEVKKDNKGPIITISRTHPGLIKRLFELEVPEINDGTVLIMGISREPGSRAKMSVMSRDPEVDAIGSCIGARGARINSIVNELKGEKIDIVKYSEVPEEYIKMALSPATVKDVIFVEDKSYKAIVDEDQLSLAIGKEGQNARLAVKLTGFKIDIHTSKEE